MSEAAQSTVKDFEDDLETAGTDDSHSPIGPEAGSGDVSTLDNHSPIGAETLDNHSPIGAETLDNHSPIGPEKDGAVSADDGDVTTLDNHSPNAPPKGN